MILPRFRSWEDNDLFSLVHLHRSWDVADLGWSFSLDSVPGTLGTFALSCREPVHPPSFFQTSSQRR